MGVLETTKLCPGKHHSITFLDSVLHVLLIHIGIHKRLLGDHHGLAPGLAEPPCHVTGDLIRPALWVPGRGDRGYEIAAVVPPSRDLHRELHRELIVRICLLKRVYAVVQDEISGDIEVLQSSTWWRCWRAESGAKLLTLGVGPR